MSDLVERLRADIEGWERAYPLSVFPEPDFKRAEALLKREGVSLGAISASNMRHVVSCLAPGIHESLAHIETLQAELAEARAKVERAREALGEAADAVRAYLPPDGISEPDFIARVIAAVDSPAAFAVLQEIEP